MTPKQQIRAARFIFIHFTTANGSQITLNIGKNELHRLMREDGADPEDEELWSWEYVPGGSLHISIFT